MIFFSRRPPVDSPTNRSSPESGRVKYEREACYPREYSRSRSRSRSPSYRDYLERGRVASYPASYGKSSDRKRALSPSRESYGRLKRYSPSRDSIEKEYKYKKRDPYERKEDCSSRRSDVDVRNYGRSSVKRERYSPVGDYESKSKRLYSREGEEWDYKEKKKRRVVNYGKLSDDEDYGKSRSYLGSDDEYEKRKTSKSRREVRYDDRTKDEYLSSKKRIRRSRSRSRSKDWDYDKRSKKSENRYSRYPEDIPSRNKDYGRYKEEIPVSKVLRKSSENDLVASLFTNMKSICKNIGGLGMSSNWIRLMHDNAIQLKEKKEDTLGIIDKEAIDVLKIYVGNFKKEIGRDVYTKSETNLLKETLVKIEEVLQTAAVKADPYLGLNIEVLARGYMGVDTSGILKGVRNSLALTGYNDIKEDFIMQIYIAIKVEQEKLLKKYDSSKGALESAQSSNQGSASKGVSYPTNIPPPSTKNLLHNNYSQMAQSSSSLSSQGAQCLQAPPPPIISGYQSTPSVVAVQPPHGAIQVPPPTIPGITAHMPTGYMQQIPSHSLPDSYSQMSQNTYNQVSTSDVYNQPPPLPPTLPQQPPPLPPGPHPSAYHPGQPPPPSLYGVFNPSTGSTTASTSGSLNDTQNYSQMQMLQESAYPQMQSSYYSTDQGHYSQKYDSSSQYNQQVSSSSNGSVSSTSYSKTQVSTSKNSTSFKDINNMKPEQLIDMFSQFHKLPAFQQSFLLQVLEEFKRKDPTLAETVKKMMEQSSGEPFYDLFII